MMFLVGYLLLGALTSLVYWRAWKEPLSLLATLAWPYWALIALTCWLIDNGYVGGEG